MPKTGELSRLFEIDRTTLNYYVKNGIIGAVKEDNQYHIYSFADSLALAYVRYYRGMGFSTDEIRGLLSEDDRSGMLERAREKQRETHNLMRMLRLKGLYLEKHVQTLRLIGQQQEPVRLRTNPWYFIRKSDIGGDPFWTEIYKMLPSVEFMPYYNRGTTRVEMPDLFRFSGVTMEKAWLEELSLEPPANSLFHAGEERYMVSWRLPADHPERVLSEKVRAFFEAPPAGIRLEETFVLYLIPIHYRTGEAYFEAFCLFQFVLD